MRGRVGPQEVNSFILEYILKEKNFKNLLNMNSKTMITH